jgi:hypothetical protein
MKRIPDPDLPPSRAALPEGCSDLFDAYQMRSAAREERAKFLLRTAAVLHDSLVAQLDPELLRSRNPDLLLARISDFLHPLLLSDPAFARKVGSSSELVEELFHVLMANLKFESDSSTAGSPLKKSPRPLAAWLNCATNAL